MGGGNVPLIILVLSNTKFADFDDNNNNNKGNYIMVSGNVYPS
jgi:hypothetical protein